MEHNKVFKNYLFFTCLVIFTILFVIALLQKNYSSTSFYDDSVTAYNSDWYQITEHNGTESRTSVNLPGDLYYNEDHQIVLETELPSNIIRGLSVYMWLDGQSIEATVGNEKVYSYGKEYEPMVGKNNGSYYSVIKVPEDAGGETLRVTITTPYNDSSFYMEDVFIGSETGLMFNLFMRRGLGMFLSMIIIFCGVVLFAIWAITHKYVNDEGLGREIFTAVYALLLGAWLFAQSRLYQVFTGNEYAMIVLYYAGFLLLPVPYLYSVAATKNNHMRKLVMLVAYLFAINSVVNVVMQYAGIRDFSENTQFTQYLYVAMIVVISLNAIIEVFRYKNKDFNLVALGILFMAFFAVIEQWSYFSQPSHVVGDYIRYGEVLVVFVMLYEAVHRLMVSMEATRNAEYYERLATVDMMANCYSRTAYNQDLEEMCKHHDEGSAIIMFDLNFLKKINDNYGHQAGDQAIRTCSLCIRKVFDKVGKVYRIGGDEFVVLMKECDEYKLLQRLALFQRLTQEQDKHLEYDFKVASGYAIYDSVQDDKFEDTVKRADYQMYARKKSMKTAVKQQSMQMQ